MLGDRKDEYRQIKSGWIKEREDLIKEKKLLA